MIRASQELASKVPTQKPPPETGRWLSERLVQNVLTLEESLQRFYTGCKNFDIAVIYRRDKRDIPGLFVLHVPVSNGESTGKIQSFREYVFVIRKYAALSCASAAAWLTTANNATLTPTEGITSRPYIFGLLALSSRTASFDTDAVMSFSLMFALQRDASRFASPATFSFENEAIAIWVSALVRVEAAAAFNVGCSCAACTASA